MGDLAATNRILKIAYPEYDVASIIEARRSAALEYVSTHNERKRELAIKAIQYYDSLLIEFLNLMTHGNQ